MRLPQEKAVQILNRSGVLLACNSSLNENFLHLPPSVFSPKKSLLSNWFTDYLVWLDAFVSSKKDKYFEAKSTLNSSDVPESSLSSQSYLNFFRFESRLGRVESEHNNCRVIGLQSVTRTVESLVCKPESNSSQMKFCVFLMSFFPVIRRPTYYKMVPDKLGNGAQCCFSKSDSRLFKSKFF